MKDVTDVDYRHAKKVFKNFNNKNVGDYHDFYVHSDTLLLADVFDNFRNKCINNYVVHIRSLEQALDYGIILKKVNKVM